MLEKMSCFQQTAPIGLMKTAPVTVTTRMKLLIYYVGNLMETRKVDLDLCDDVTGGPHWSRSIFYSWHSSILGKFRTKQAANAATPNGGEK